MWKIIMISVSAILAAVSAEPQPFIVSAPLIASPYTSAYLSAPGPVVAAPVTASLVAAPVAQAYPATVPATVPASVPAAVPAAYPAIPYSSVSAYSYGSSYSIQDYLPVVNPAPATLTYSLPYAYAADYFYRR